MKRWRSVQYIGVIGFALSLTACGAPDLSVMRPHVKKPTVAVLLIDQPAHWRVSAVQEMAVASGLESDVRNISSNQMDTSLHQLMGNKSVDLVVFVQNAPIQQSELDAVKQNIGQRFEWIGTQAATGTALNVRQVVPDPLTTSYTLGWLAGQFGLTLGVQNVGWITDGQTESTPDQVKSALLGAYSANSAFQAVPLNMAGLDTTVPLPKLVLTTRPLTTQELQTLKTAGTDVISLCAQSETSFAAKPVLPDSSVLAPDFRAVVNMNWQAATVMTRQPPFVWTNSDVVPADLITNVSNVEAGLQAGPVNVQASWQRIPSQIRQLWSSIPGATNP